MAVSKWREMLCHAEQVLKELDSSGIHCSITPYNGWDGTGWAHGLNVNVKDRTGNVLKTYATGICETVPQMQAALKRIESQIKENYTPKTTKDKGYVVKLLFVNDDGIDTCLCRITAPGSLTKETIHNILYREHNCLDYQCGNLYKGEYATEGRSPETLASYTAKKNGWDLEFLSPDMEFSFY